MPATPSFQEILAQVNASGGGLGAAKQGPTVYLGQSGKYLGSTFVQTDKRLSVDQAKSDIYSWSDEERTQWGKRLYGAGLLDDANDWDGMIKAWGYAVEQTAGLNAGSKPNLTPWNFIGLLEQQGAFKENLAARAKRDNAEAEALRRASMKHVSTSYNAIPDRSDADAAIKTLFREQLGRDPEDGELDRYASMMLRKMKADPGKSVSVSDPVTGTTTSRSYAGFNPAGMLEDKVKADPEWGAYQAATTYYNALQGAIGAPG